MYINFNQNVSKRELPRQGRNFFTRKMDWSCHVTLVGEQAKKPKKSSLQFFLAFKKVVKSTNGKILIVPPGSNNGVLMSFHFLLGGWKLKFVLKWLFIYSHGIQSTLPRPHWRVFFTLRLPTSLIVLAFALSAFPLSQDSFLFPLFPMCLNLTYAL